MQPINSRKPTPNPQFDHFIPFLKSLRQSPCCPKPNNTKNIHNFLDIENQNLRSIINKKQAQNLKKSHQNRSKKEKNDQNRAEIDHFCKQKNPCISVLETLFVNKLTNGTQGSINDKP
jgi:hypothetical protein